MSCKQKPSISFTQGFLGTVLHTSVDYLAPTAGLPTVNISEYVGRRLAPHMEKRSQHCIGLLVHFILGTIIFPQSYNLIVRHVLPKKTAGSAIWAMLLWFTGQTIILPLCGASKDFQQKPKRIFTYWLAHVLYGWACSGKQS